MTTLEKGVTAPAAPTPTTAILEALAPVDSLTIAELRARVAADWPTGRLGRTLDLLREQRLIERVRIDTYAITLAGKVEVSRG